MVAVGLAAGRVVGLALNLGLAPGRNSRPLRLKVGLWIELVAGLARRFPLILARNSRLQEALAGDKNKGSVWVAFL